MCAYMWCDRKMSEITMCTLCKKQQSNGKLLPCLHAFCLKCLEDSVLDPVPGSELTCPTCEDTSKIPDDGLSALPANCLVDNVLRLRSIREVEKDLECDICAPEAAKPIPVTSYCFECRQNMCDECSSYHMKFASTKGHKVVCREIEESSSFGLEDIDWCNKHEDRRQELFCRECGSAVCIRCYTEKHNSHICSDIGTVAEEFREQMQKAVEEMEQLTIENQLEEQELHRARDDILDQVTEVEFQVLRSREELISCVERDTNELMNDLQYFRDIVTSEFDVSSNKIRKRSGKIDSLKQFTREVMKEGTASVVANVASALNQRESEIRAQHQKSRVRNRPSVDVVFQTLGLSALSQAKTGRKINLVGKITGTILQPESESASSLQAQTSFLPNYPELIFKFGSKGSVSENPRCVHLPRMRYSKRFRSCKGSKSLSYYDVIRRRGRTEKASNLSSPSDEDNVQNSDDDMATPVAEAVATSAAKEPSKTPE